MAAQSPPKPQPMPALNEMLQRTPEQLGQSRIKVWTELSDIHFPDLSSKILKYLQSQARPDQRGVDEAWAHACDGLTGLPAEVQQAADFLRENMKQEAGLIQMDQGGTILAFGITGGIKLIRVGLYGLNGEVETVVARLLQPGTRDAGEQIRLEILWQDPYALEGRMVQKGETARAQRDKAETRMETELARIAANKEEQADLMRLFDLARAPTPSLPSPGRQADKTAQTAQPLKKTPRVAAKKPGKKPKLPPGGPTYHKTASRRKK